MKLYAGIDLHSNNHVVVVSDEDGKQVYRKRLSNDLDKTLSSLAPYQSEIEGVAVESTYNWYWLVDGLMDHGYRLGHGGHGGRSWGSGLERCLSSIHKVAAHYLSERCRWVAGNEVLSKLYPEYRTQQR